MKRLLVLRHAKSSWADPGVRDRDRPLAARGREAAPKIGDYLRDRSLLPQLVVCSSAVRARETVALLDLDDAEIEISDDLYQADVPELVGCTRAIAESVSSAMLVGHNPGMHDFVSALGLDVPKFPTAALAAFEFGSGWADFPAEMPEVVDYVVPRDL